MSILFPTSLRVLAAIAALTVAAQAQLGIKSVGSVQKKDGPMQVTVVFTEPVDSATGADTANYGLGGGVTINKATLMTGLPADGEAGNGDSPPNGRVFDNQCVVLEVTGLGSAQTTLTVNGVKNAAGTSTLAGGNKSFVPSGYKYVEVASLYASPAPGHRAGQVIAVGNDGFDIFNNGRTGWGNEDEYTLVYKEVRGDFDFKARVEFQDFGSRWSRAGVLARERLDDGATEGCMGRYCSAHADPSRSWDSDAAGTRVANNQFESNYRDVDYSGESPVCGDGSHTAYGNDTKGNGGGTPEYPNAWVRLKREGSTLTAYYGNDGVNWSDGWERTYDPPLADTLYLGPGFCIEWGNINAANGDPARQRYYLAQIRFSELTTPIVKSFAGSPLGFTYVVQDSVTALNPATIKLTFNGSAVQASSVTPAGNLTTIVYHSPTILASGSVNAASIEFKDNGAPPATVTSKNNFTLSYVSLPPETLVSGVDKSKPGFLVRTWQVGSGQGNTSARSEQELFGELGDNIADPSLFTDMVGDNGYYDEEGVINYWDNGGVGNFPNDTQNVPGVASADNYAVEVVTYLEFPAPGIYRMGVNSDDGFRVQVGKNIFDRFQLDALTLGEFSGGRGVADTTFDFFVPQAGLYPFRTTWEEGGGDSACEWFSIKGDGTKVLINDTGTDAEAIKAYRKGPVTDRAYIKSVRPGAGVVAPADAAIEVVVVDAKTKLVAGSVHLSVDGAAKAPNVSSAGGTTTISLAAPAAGWGNGDHVVDLSYDETTTPASTRSVSFTITIKVRIQDLDPQSFVIEAEDFDYDRGQTNPQKGVAGMDVDVMPYYGGAYDGLSAVENVDYANNDGNDSDVYRTETDSNGENQVDITDNLGGQWGRERPGYEVTSNYRIGWVDTADWQNYTRVIPAGTYNFYAALSYNGTAAGQLRAKLSKVTAGIGTTAQTVVDLGSWNAPGSGGWGRNDIVPMRGPDGSLLVAKLGGKTTLRVTLDSGDFDYFILAPDKTSKAKITSAAPGDNALDTARNDGITVTIEDFATKVVTSSIKLMVDGADVTAGTTVGKPADVATVKYAPAGGAFAVGLHTYALTFSDNGTPAKQTSFNATFNAGPLPKAEAFVIEAEDFNYDSGKTVAAASVMPYLGNAYNGLGATSGVDYNKDDGNDSDVYRTEQDAGGENAVNINDNLGGRWGSDRGTWSVTTNYKIGWIGGGQWFNFTRDIPTGSYEVWAALSFDGRDPSQLSGGLARVTSDPSQPNQTTENLGVFDRPGSAGWGANNLVPLTDTAGGTRVVISAGPKTTLRMNSSSGDFDWFVLVPAAAPPKPPKITAIRLNGDGTVTVEWVNGTLQAAPTVLGPWQDVTGATSPLKLSPTGAMQFGRVRQ